MQFLTQKAALFALVLFLVGATVGTIAMLGV